jgi:hypothetical protein
MQQWILDLLGTGAAEVQTTNPGFSAQVFLTRLYTEEESNDTRLAEETVMIFYLLFVPRTDQRMQKFPRLANCAILRSEVFKDC